MKLKFFLCFQYSIVYIYNRPSEFLDFNDCEESETWPNKFIFMIDSHENLPPKLNEKINGEKLYDLLYSYPFSPIIAKNDEIPDFGDSHEIEWTKFAQETFREKIFFLTYSMEYIKTSINFEGFYWNEFLIRLLKIIQCKDSVPHNSNKKALLLGGDGESRYQLFNNVYNLNGLNSNATLWSLSKPASCHLPICKILPKELDISLYGTNPPPEIIDNKDVTFPDFSLYRNTSYSIVPESMVTHGNLKFYFTEKIFKPLYMGHPFVHICSKASVWPFLSSLGFKSYPKFENPLLFINDLRNCLTKKYAWTLVQHMKHIQHLDDETWKIVFRNADMNRKLFSCELRHILKRRAKSYLDRISSQSDFLVPMCRFDSPIVRTRSGKKFCKKIKTQCKHIWQTFNYEKQNEYSIILDSKQQTICGFGTDLMERAGGVALGLHLKRNVIEFKKNDESMRILFKPHPKVFSKEKYNIETYNDHDECMKQIESNSSIKFRCLPLDNKFIIEVDPGEKIEDLKPIHDWPKRNLHFVSHNSYAAFSSLVIGKNQEITKGFTLSSGPGCIMNRLLYFVSYHVLMHVYEMFKKYQKVVGIHIRLGDSAIYRECPKCVDQNEPDIRSSDRIEIDNLEKRLIETKKTIQNTPVYLATDTLVGWKLGSKYFNVINNYSKAIHSTQVKYKIDAKNIATDFVSLVISDRIFCYGSSSISYNAASMSFKECE